MLFSANYAKNYASTIRHGQPASNLWPLDHLFVTLSTRARACTITDKATDSLNLKGFESSSQGRPRFASLRNCRQSNHGDCKVSYLRSL